MTTRTASPPTTLPTIAPVGFFFGDNGDVVVLVVGVRVEVGLSLSVDIPLEVGLSLGFDNGWLFKSCIPLSNALTATVWFALENTVLGGPVHGIP